MKIHSVLGNKRLDTVLEGEGKHMSNDGMKKHDKKSLVILHWNLFYNILRHDYGEKIALAL